MKIDNDTLEESRESTEAMRECLACRQPFASAWAGERICPKCKSTAAWRSG